MQQANSAFSKKQYQSSIEFNKSILTKYKDDIPSKDKITFYYNIALAYSLIEPSCKKNDEEAIKYCQEILNIYKTTTKEKLDKTEFEIKKDKKRIYLIMLDIYVENNSTEEASECFKEINKLNSTYFLKKLKRKKDFVLRNKEEIKKEIENIATLEIKKSTGKKKEKLKQILDKIQTNYEDSVINCIDKSNREIIVTYFKKINKQKQKLEKAKKTLYKAIHYYNITIIFNKIQNSINEIKKKNMKNQFEEQILKNLNKAIEFFKKTKKVEEKEIDSYKNLKSKLEQKKEGLKLIDITLTKTSTSLSETKPHLLV